MEQIRINNLWISTIDINKVNPIFGDIIIRDGKIKKIIKKDFKKYNFTKRKLGKNEYDADGRVATVPLVNFHDHFYSRLAKGLAIKGSTNNFINILKNLWWKLDSILDKEMIRASAQMSILESINNGVLYIFDHHSSPNYANGSLETIADELNKFKLNGVLCFETTDRNGQIFSGNGFSENIYFTQLNTDKIRSLFGLHASFTLTDETLKAVGQFIKKNKSGIHIHLTEDEYDRKESKKSFGELPLERLLKYGLVNKNSILSHCIHLTKDEYKLINEKQAAIAINLDSNFNNGVGSPNFKNIDKDTLFLLGTDGMHANLGKAFKTLFLNYRHKGFTFEETFYFMTKLYFNQIKFVKRFYPDYPSLQEESKADLIIWDYIPPTPLNCDNFFGHYIYGILEREIFGVINEGEILKYNNSIKTKDLNKINENIVKQGHRLFKKFSSL